MTGWGGLAVDLIIILILIAGIAQFRTPAGARRGNLTAAGALAFALAVVVWRHRLMDPLILIPMLVVGAAVGWIIAQRVSMIQIPALVAFQHGAGGVAAFLVSFVELAREPGEVSGVALVSGLLGLVIGAATFSGSMVASGKLANRMKQTPMVLPQHNLVLAGLVLAVAAVAAIAGMAQGSMLLVWLAVLVVLAVLLGIVFSIRIGGADMPVLISFLNATAGLAAAFCGVIIGNRLLIACGATVAASGSILTHVMCVSMNRSLVSVFTGIRHKTSELSCSTDLSAAVTDACELPLGTADSAAADSASSLDPLAQAALIAKDAESVIIIPGYGMALAHAAPEVVALGRSLEKMGKDVRYAVHPVAGRMPGHMHVLLAEAEVDYDKLYEMKDINSRFPDTDLALIVGACDVVNPAAVDTEGTPISGMPILRADEARHAVVLNLDEKPGYSGVPNTLYDRPKTILLFGDAKATLQQLSAAFNEACSGGEEA